MYTYIRFPKDIIVISTITITEANKLMVGKEPTIIEAVKLNVDKKPIGYYKASVAWNKVILCTQ